MNVDCEHVGFRPMLTPGSKCAKELLKAPSESWDLRAIASKDKIKLDPTRLMPRLCGIGTLVRTASLVALRGASILKFPQYPQFEIETKVLIPIFSLTIERKAGVFVSKDDSTETRQINVNSMFPLP